MFTTEHWQAGKRIIKSLKEKGYEAVFVGGAVRDFLLQKEANDVDIATSALPEEVKEVFKRTVDVGLAHGTVLVIEDRIPIEVTTFRSDGEYKDHRRPSDVKFVLSLEEDLKRRDFTMNALAMTESFQIIDLFDGRLDLEKRIIKTVGDPFDRFKEDALRMLRAIRFSAQLDFSIDHQTLEAVQSCAHDLSYVSVERVTAELEKIWVSKNLYKGMTYLNKSSLAEQLPGDFPFSHNKWKDIGNPQNTMVCWAFLCLLQEEPSVSDLARVFKLSNDSKRQIKQLVKATTIRSVRMFELDDFYFFDEEILVHAERLVQVLVNGIQPMAIDTIIQSKRSLPIHSKADLVVTGKDLMNWFSMRGGPWLKKALAEIEMAVLHQKVVNDATKIKEWIMNESNSKI